MQACTIVARNYLAQARVLVRSFKRVHPTSRFVVLVVDDREHEERSGAEFDVMNLDEIGLDAGDAGRMPMIYNVTELSTAVKPWLLRSLLKSSAEPVIYFDPDIEIFAPIDHLAKLAAEHSIVLTPHVTDPIPRDKLSLSESDILGAGIYNLGFIAIGPGSESFLDWWAVRLRRECVVDPKQMRFTDQRWVDFVPGLYRHVIVRDPTLNVAYWNLHGRDLRWNAGRYEVNGAPLHFFHFSGYDPDKPHILSKHQGERPRILLSERPFVARICGEYREKLLAEGFDEEKRNRYGFDSLPNGIKVDWYIQRLFREAVRAFEEGDGPEPPNPFAREGGDFLQWLNEPMRADDPVITRYMLAIHRGRPDLQQAFPEPLGASAAAFRQWFLTQGVDEVHAHPDLVPRAEIVEDRGAANGDTAQALRLPPVNVVGYLRAELGVGEAARLLITALEAANLPFNAITNAETLSRQQHAADDDRGALSGDADINIVCINADQTPAFARKAGHEFFDGRYTIGVWFWEVEDFPPEYYGAINHVDEVWVASEFIHANLARISPKPVFKFNLPIVAPNIDPAATKESLGLPDRFTFLFSFDFFSVVERKNPVGVIEAFRRAFEPGEGPALVIKTINGDRKLLDLEKVRFAAAGHPDITIVDGYVSAVEKNTITALCDCYVSLHRSEGYGLTMAEAMALGKPVIATAYSGNLDFMTPENSYLCSYSYKQVGAGAPPYPPNSRWADPDLDEAAALMREVYTHSPEARARGRRAAAEILELHSPIAAGRVVAERLKTIRYERLTGAPLPWLPPPRRSNGARPQAEAASRAIG